MSSIRRYGLVSVLLMSFAAGGCIMGHRPAAVPGTVYECEGERFVVETVAWGLQVPWALAWTPKGRLLVTERPGRLCVVEPGERHARVLALVPDVDAALAHGLMGIALSPDLEKDRTLFVSYTTRDARGFMKNCVARYRLVDDELVGGEIVVDELPAADDRNALPLAFGPDGKLYASTGDGGNGWLAQRLDSFAGKFLRMNPDGTVPEGNPFSGSLIWSLGHRNCRGFDWHPASGHLFATERGPSFLLEGSGGGDELNVVVPGWNYGWPKYHHERTGKGCVAPLMESGSDTLAPGGAAFYSGDVFPQWKGRFFFAGLRGEALWCVTLTDTDSPEVVRATRFLHRQFGRLRAVAQGPDGYLYFTTSNRDGRGQPIQEDDRILRLVPAPAETAAPEPAEQ